MSRRDDRTLLQDMADTARAALIAIQGRDASSLAQDHVWSLGLVKSLEIIGEAAGRVSAGFRSQHGAIPWDRIIGMRNRLVHAYFEIDYELVWKTLVEDLPPLLKHLEAILMDRCGDDR